MNSSLIAENSPHAHSVSTTGKIMSILMLSLIPALGAHIWYFGWGIVVTMLLTVITCSLTEIAMLKLRGHGIHALWRDRSAWVTAVLLAFALPPLLPWHLTVIGSIFAIAIVKHAFGGLGQNIFNPAMAGFVFLLVSTPLPMTTYVNAVPDAMNSITFSRSAQVIFGIDKEETLTKIHQDQLKVLSDGVTGASASDGVTGATFLIDAKHRQPEGKVAKFTAKHMGSLEVTQFKAKTICALMFLLGGIVLLWKRIIDWRIPVTFITISTLLATIFWLCSPEKYLPPLWHLSFGATVFCAFYILTDPVTAVSRPRGAIIYACTAAFIFIIIRNCGGYPDAAAFCTLTANALAPLIAILTVRRPFGSGSKPEDITK